MPHCRADMAYPGFNSVLYTRGGGCEELATLLSPTATRVKGDLGDACIEHRADLLVTRKPPGGFGLVSVATPIDFMPEKVGRVVAAVSGGPHSGLAARLANGIAESLEVTAAVASAFFDDENKAEAEAVVERFAGEMHEADRFIIGADDPSGFVSQLPEDSLIVMGEPGGSFLSRIFFGAGARLRAAVPAGAIVVRHSPARVFHVMEEPVFVGPLHEAGDTLRLHHHAVMAVAENGLLIGTIKRSTLEGAGGQVPVGELMDPPLSVGITDLLEEVFSSPSDLQPMPVTDGDGKLLGSVHLPSS